AVAVAGLLAGLAAWRGHSWADVAVGTARTVLAIPALAVALCVISVGGRAPVLIGGMFAFCGLPYVATRLRVLFASALRWPFVDAARLVGASPVRIGERHLFPHLARPLLAAAVGLLPLFFMLEATLGFFGFSLTPTIPTWGTLLWRGREALHRGDWWLLGFPMMFVAATAWASMRIAAALDDPLPPTYVVTRKLVLGREWGDAATQTTVSRGRGPVPAPARLRARPAPASAAAQGGAGNGASGDGSSG
ncbi:MAG TPA: ABC transporter permease subunit, partial [bacterium]|nr:ABC transporter permease subunit [bacterium]